MPLVEQYDWDKLKPKHTDNMRDDTNNDRLYWRYKKKTPPKATSKRHGKVKRVKPVDPTIFNDDYDHRQHLKDIHREQ